MEQNEASQPQRQAPGEHESSSEAISGTQAQNSSPAEITRFVTSIKNLEQQVGEHVIRALQHADTVAVLTSVVAGPGGQQHIVSAALNPTKTSQVNALLQSAATERVDEEMCVGFHCLIKPKPTRPEDNK